MKISVKKSNAFMLRNVVFKDFEWLKNKTKKMPMPPPPLINGSAFNRKNQTFYY